MKSRLIILLLLFSFNCFSQNIDYIYLMTKIIEAKTDVFEEYLNSKEFESLTDENYSNYQGYFAENYQSIKSESDLISDGYYCTLISSERFYFINPKLNILLIYYKHKPINFGGNGKTLEIRLTSSNKEKVYQSTINKLESNNEYKKADYNNNDNVSVQFTKACDANEYKQYKYSFTFITPSLGSSDKIYKIILCKP